VLKSDGTVFQRGSGNAPVSVERVSRAQDRMMGAKNYIPAVGVGSALGEIVEGTCVFGRINTTKG